MVNYGVKSQKNKIFETLPKMSEYGYHRSMFWRNTKIFRNKNILISDSKNRHLVIYLDVLIVNKKIYLITSNGKYVIGFV